MSATAPPPPPLPPRPNPSPEADRHQVEALLGRAPFTQFRVAVRCPHGGPAVLENDPVDLRGRPFPTRYWLACRALHEAVSRLESTGAIKELDDDPEMASHLRAAHAQHAALHAGKNIAGAGDDGRAKCLHAQLAFGLAQGGGPLVDWIAARADIAWPATCCADRETEERG